MMRSPMRSFHSIGPTLCVLGCGFLLISGAGVAVAQESKSATAARQLGELLERHKLDSIAASDPAAPDTFVAALHFPDAQLLVVSARYSAPSLLTGKIASKEYRDVYIDLNAASVAGTKVFVMDHGADGLTARAAEFQAADTLEQGNKTTVFDGDWRAAKISEQDYVKTFTTADERYARLLELLAEQASTGGS